MHARVHIGHELWRQIEPQLKPGEAVLWAGQPVPHFFTLFTTVCLVAGLAWNVGFLWFISREWQPPTSSGDEIVSILGTLLFLSLTLQLTLMPVKLYRRALRCVYVLSDRRAILVKLGRQVTYDSYPFHGITQIRLIEKNDSTGDVIMVCGVRHDGLPPPFGGDPGFYHIERATEIAGIFVELLAADNTSRVKTTPLLVTVPQTRRDGKYWRILFMKTIVPIGAVALIIGIPASFGWLTNTSWAGFFSMLFLFLLLSQFRTMRLAGKSLTWPSVEGTIIESYVHSDEDGSRSRIRYCYQIGDKAYENDVISYNPRVVVQAEKPAKTVVARYPEGGPVTVYYHPGKPDHAVLERGGGKGNRIAFVLLSICFLASTVWMASAWQGIDADSLFHKWDQVKQFTGVSDIINNEEGKFKK